MTTIRQGASPPATPTPDWQRHYDKGVPTDIRVDFETLTEMFAESARLYPRRAALWSAAGALSFEQLHAEVRKFGSALAGLGLKPGDRVVVLLPNSLQAVVALYGTLWIGGIAVLTAPEAAPELLERQLADARPLVAVCPSPLPQPLLQVMRKAKVLHLILSSGKEYSRNLRGWLRVAARLAAGRPQRRFLRWRRLMREASEDFPMYPVEPDAPAIIEYTGGTTGSPRGVVLSHRALVANTLQLAAWDPRIVRGKERIVGALPFYHAYGLSAGLNLSLHVGGTLLLPPEIAPIPILETASRFKPTLFPGVPMLYAALLNQRNLRSYGLKSIRACISGAAPLPIEIQEGFEKVTKGKLVEGYGLTEAGPVTHANPIYGKRRVGSIGVPLPGTEAKILDIRTGEELPPGKVGELVVRGPQLMDGYWKAPEATARVLRDGWLHTGDLAQRDEDGFFFLINRKDDVLTVEGKMIFPRDIEEVLYEHASVQDAAVVGYPATNPCEEIRAFVALRPGKEASPEELVQLCRRRLPPGMVPGRVVILARMPRTRLGKLLRRELNAAQT